MLGFLRLNLIRVKEVSGGRSDRAGLTVVADLNEGFWHGTSGEGDHIFYDAIVDFALLDVEEF